MKGELIPTILYAEGRPRDVGTDRALANALNQYVDRKSAHQSPWLHNAGIIGVETSQSHLIRPIFFGTEHISATVVRSVTVAPWIRSSTGSTATFRATLFDGWPVNPPASSSWAAPRFPGAYVQATWTTTSTAWSTGADATLSLSVKNLEWGFAFLLMESIGLANCAECRGFAKCIEGVRVVL